VAVHASLPHIPPLKALIASVRYNSNAPLAASTSTVGRADAAPLTKQDFAQMTTTLGFYVCTIMQVHARVEYPWPLLPRIALPSSWTHAMNVVAAERITPDASHSVIMAASATRVATRIVSASTNSDPNISVVTITTFVVTRARVVSPIKGADNLRRDCLREGKVANVMEADKEYQKIV